MDSAHVDFLLTVAELYIFRPYFTYNYLGFVYQNVLIKLNNIF